MPYKLLQILMSNSLFYFRWNINLLVGSSKRAKVEKQSKALPFRSNQTGFSWYKRSCSEPKCSGCGINAKLGNVQQTTASSVDNICNYEFDCRDDDGEKIAVVVKVKMYCDHMRSGSFQKKWKR